LLLGLLFVAVLCVTSYRALVHRSDELADAMRRVNERTELIAKNQNDVVDHVREMLTLLLVSNDFASFSLGPHCPQLLAYLVRNDHRVANLLFAMPNGDVQCNATHSASPINIADRAYFQQALAADGPIIGEAVTDRTSGKWSLPFAQASRDKSGHVQGVMVAALDLGWLKGALANDKYSEGLRVGLFDHDGTVLVRYPDQERLTGRDLAGTPLFASIVARGGAGAVEEAGLDNIRRIYGFTPFARTSAGPIYLWIGEQRDVVLAAPNRDFIETILFTFVLAGTLLAAIWFYGERLFIGPVAAMAAAARRLGHGEFDARTGIRHTPDELGQLARTIDGMAEALLSKSELLQLNRALRVLSQCNQALIRATSESALLNDICRILVELGGYRMAWVGYAEHDANQRVRAVAEFGHEDHYVNDAEITWADTERGQGPTGTAIRTGTLQVNQNFATNPKLAPWRADALRRGYASSSAVPLKDGGMVFGALTIYSEKTDAFSPEEAKLLVELADDLAFGIVTLRMKSAHEQSAARIVRSMESTVQAIAATLETRDAYTGGHQRRVAALAGAIAREIGMPADEVHGLQLAATIHDIGKISVPADILTKPSRLSTAEMSIVKAHAQSGYDIVKGVDFPWPIAQLILQHHERLDGSGYPSGLKGDQLLPGAKVLAVADVVDAMMSHRPYRAALGIDAALDEIAINRGRLYDPIVCDACRKLFKEQGFKLAA
jgi:HD-GYP domain-containing protein (c-di-GMP phosphodiesterase class II)/HAMP domain-containing protein